MEKRQLIPLSVTAYFDQIRLRVQHFWSIHWLRISLVALVAFLMYTKDVTIGLQFTDTAVNGHYEAPNYTEKSTATAMNTSLVKRVPPKEPAPKPVSDNGPEIGNTYSNMSYTDKGIHSGDKLSKRAAKRKKQLAYVERYKGIAIKEMNKYGIPASITLAQGLLESNVGESRLATKNNNHFGMKCFSRKCRRGHCSNFEDDSHKDFFRIYKSVDESYRAHSMLLKNGKRYRRLFSYNRKDYKSWSHGLKKAGYATDPRYAEKLINLIEDLKLHEYDR